MGQATDGHDSKAVQVSPDTHWPEMRILVLVVNDQKKDTSSTDGMQQSVKTSKLMKVSNYINITINDDLIKERINIVPHRMQEMEQAILSKDYETFGKLTMQDSDDFHAVCADTDPPIYYLKPISHQIIHIIKCFNTFSGKTKVIHSFIHSVDSHYHQAAYTFDAGPNAVIYLLQENVVPILALVMHYFPPQKTPLTR